MPMIAISDELLHRLEELAAEDNLSLEEQVEKLLQFEMDARSRDKDIVARWDKIAAMSPKPGPLSDSLALLREDRHR